MPTKPQRPCRYPLCPYHTSDRSGYCANHIHLAQHHQRQYDRDRGSPSSRGYDSQWVKVRRAQLTEHPLCHDCEAQGIVTAATMVHHKDENPRNNLQGNLVSLCNACHEKRHGNRFKVSY